MRGFLSFPDISERKKVQADRASERGTLRGFPLLQRWTPTRRIIPTCISSGHLSLTRALIRDGESLELLYSQEALAAALPVDDRRRLA